MKLKQFRKEFHGARFTRAGVEWCILGSPTPDGYVVAVDAKAPEPAQIRVLKQPTPAEISKETPVDPLQWQDIGNISEVKP